jgi:hypothetical protein
VNSTASITTVQAATPSSPVPGRGWAVPVSRSAANGGPAGSDTRTMSGPPASQRATTDPAAGSSSRLPPRVAQSGTSPRGDGTPARKGSVTVAVMARASVVRARSGSEGPGSTSKSMTRILLR